MGKYLFLAVFIALSGVADASWYWPFGSDESTKKREPRLSELMAPASSLIDEASDLAADGKTDEAVEKYRLALGELDRIERENPARAERPEFATIRNKRAYVNAAIDSLLLSQVKANARAVAVSDTTELEKRLAAEKGEGKRGKREELKGKREEKKVKRESPREQAMASISSGDFETAERLINEMLVTKPNGAMALNLKATMLSRQGKFKEAESVLDQAINSNPRNHAAYYNMAILILQMHPDATDRARRYYETGRAYGGPKDNQLEALLIK